MSRKPHEATEKTRAEVAALKSFGVTYDDIAKYLGIDKKTLIKYYREDLDLAEIKANAQVQKFLFNTASGRALKDGASYSDCVRAAMFWAKTRMGWRETTNLDHTSSDGSAVATRVVIRAKKSKDDD
jgi:DNA-binding CsgD family transcriptional regulator